MNSNKNNSNLFFLIALIAVFFGAGGFFAGRFITINSLSSDYMSSTEANQSDYNESPASTDSAKSDQSDEILHYSCNICGFSFDDLRPLRMEYQSNNAIHGYFCPVCGELLTSDNGGNALENLKNNDYYRNKVTDNWE